MLYADILPKNGNLLNFDDTSIVAGSVSVTMSTCRQNMFDFGTFNAAVLKMSVIDDDALDHEFSGASVMLRESDEQEQSVYLGTYYIDGTTVKRVRNTVTFSAYDRAVKFDIEISDNIRSTSYTALTAIQAACSAAGNTVLYNADLNDFPNISVTFTLENAALQTWRDVVMWCCQLCAANAIIDRMGRLKIIHARWQHEGTEDHVINAEQRISVQFSDARIYPKYMTAYSGTAVKEYVSGYTPEGDQAVQSQPGTLQLDSNPLLAGKDDTECDTVNRAIIGNIQSFTQRQITAKLFQNGDIGLGDAVRFLGGNVDVRRSILGMVTYIVWKYHGATTVTCTAPKPAEVE
ncbi:MAG: hypothetical protein IK990_07800 [Ruminiclostridium sp.]|nr:hypothetical protein [Ruminiclostridium sp.]